MWKLSAPKGKIGNGSPTTGKIIFVNYQLVTFFIIVFFQGYHRFLRIFTSKTFVKVRLKYSTITTNLLSNIFELDQFMKCKVIRKEPLNILSLVSFWFCIALVEPYSFSMLLFTII